MKLLLSWVEEYVSLKGVEPKKLADLLVNIGFEVEEIIDVGRDISNVVTGRILEIIPHPNADKLTVCKVEIARNKVIQIVTGAKNISLRDIVPVALDNSTLPDGKSIKAGELRGVLSQGMFCGGSELGVDDNIIDGASVDGILILPNDTKIGVCIKEVLGLNDTILDVSITANRPDCQCVYGLAREIAAVLKRPLRPLDLRYNEIALEEYKYKAPTVNVEDSNMCSIYKGHLISKIQVKASSYFIRRRLKLLGLKPINNVVDITNYVLLEVGQPLHAFDMSKIVGDTLHIRRAKYGERIKLLDGKEYALSTGLDSGMFVIADNTKALALAGIMGGEYSAVTNDTTDIFLESARFARGSIRATSRKLGLKTDSSTRFERGVDYGSIDIGYRRALTLFVNTNAGIPLTRLLQAGSTPKEQVIVTTAKAINDLLGITVSQAKIIDILSRLEIKVVVKGKSLECTIPLFREDIICFADLAEEVIRFYGYDKIESTMFESGPVSPGGYLAIEKNIRKIKSLAIAMGANEIITYSFIAPNELDKLNVCANSPLRDNIKIINPLNEDCALMRTQLVGGMLNVVKTNLSRKNNTFRLFEVARTYVPKSLPLTELPKEQETLCLSFVGNNEDFYSIKDAITKIAKLFGNEFEFKRTECAWLHPGIGADILLNGKVVGSVGKVHPIVAKNYDIRDNMFIAQLTLDAITTTMSDIIAKRLPKYPSVERDLAIVVKSDIAVGDLITSAKKAIGTLCESVRLFDIYEGEQIEAGHKSVAFKIVLQAESHTLNDAEIHEAINSVLLVFNSDFNASLR